MTPLHLLLEASRCLPKSFAASWVEAVVEFNADEVNAVDPRVAILKDVPFATFDVNFQYVHAVDAVFIDEALQGSGSDCYC